MKERRLDPAIQPPLWHVHGGAQRADDRQWRGKCAGVIYQTLRVRDFRRRSDKLIDDDAHACKLRRTGR